MGRTRVRAEGAPANPRQRQPVLPGRDPYGYGFTPHLSVGQARGAAEARALREALESSWQPLTFIAAAIQLIWRGEPPDDVFRVTHILPLSSS